MAQECPAYCFWLRACRHLPTLAKTVIDSILDNTHYADGVRCHERLLSSGMVSRFLPTIHTGWFSPQPDACSDSFGAGLHSIAHSFESHSALCRKGRSAAEISQELTDILASVEAKQST